MPQEKVVYRAVPVAGELIPGRAVPPGRIETTVGKAGELGEDVQL